MGWWETRSGDTIGDSPLNILGECNPRPKTSVEIPPTVLLLIILAYIEDHARLPSTDEIEALVELCRE